VLPPINPWLGIPLCVATFAAASWVVGLMRRRDVDSLLGLFRRPRGGGVFTFFDFGG